MTKTVRVILIVGIFIFTCFYIAGTSHAEYFFRPVPDNYQQITTNYQPLTANQISSPSAQLLIVDNDPNYKPSITFGDLLSSSDSSTIAANYQLPTANTSTSLSTSSQLLSESSRSALIRGLLARLDNSYQQSQLNQPVQQLSNTDNRQQITDNNITQNPQPITNNSQLNPTPYIPIPTLIAGINEIVSNNQQILGIQNTSDGVQSTPPRWSNQNPPPTTNYQLPTITPTPKSTYTIAILGDSMIDTLGRDLPDIQRLLKDAYPSKSFALFNYGFGSTDMESGLKRLTSTTTYLDRSYAPLLSWKPDILVIESFAYNHWGGTYSDLDRQWTTLVKIIDTVKEYSPETKIILASTIAPNSNIYGDGVLNWGSDLKWNAANLTKMYLENMSRFASSANLPFADAYHPSLGSDGNGLKIYINSGDHLHPSAEGALFFSQKVVETIKNNQLIK